METSDATNAKILRVFVISTRGTVSGVFSQKFSILCLRKLVLLLQELQSWWSSTELSMVWLSVLNSVP